MNHIFFDYICQLYRNVFFFFFLEFADPKLLVRKKLKEQPSIFTWNSTWCLPLDWYLLFSAEGFLFLSLVLLLC